MRPNGRQPSADELISALTYTPEDVNLGMLFTNNPAKISTIKRSPTSSSIGSLDMLPPEILFAILEILDFQSLSRLSRVSLRGKSVIESLPAYRDMLAYAPDTLAVLGSTQLLKCHAASALYSALRSEGCVYCKEYGAYIYLFSCKRCCYRCLTANQSLWVIQLSAAQSCFDLAPRQVKLLPVMHSMRGIYFNRSTVSRRRVLKLTGVKEAKELSISVHGSLEILRNKLANKRQSLSVEIYELYQYLLEAPLHSQPDYDENFFPDPTTYPRDNNNGMASIHFPSVLPGKPPFYGRWCLSCKHTSENYKWHDPDTYPPSLSPNMETMFLLRDWQSRVWSDAGFVKHIEHCHSARKLAPHLWQ